MDDLAKITKMGQELGYEGSELRDFVKDQQAILRDERQAQREMAQAQREMSKLEAERKEREAERQERERERRHELAMADKGAVKIEKIEHGGAREQSRPSLPKISPFRELHDDIDSYLTMFERQAELRGWPKENWAISLASLLEEKALEVYSRMSDEDSNDYEKLKEALFLRFDITQESYRRKFRSNRPEKGETFAQYSVRQGRCLKRWIEMSKIEPDFDQLCDLLQREQFVDTCSKELRLFIQERKPQNLAEMVELAERFREARGVDASALSKLARYNFAEEDIRNKDTRTERTTVPTAKMGPTSPDKRRCYKCGRQGHVSYNCSYSKPPKIGCVRQGQRTNTKDKDVKGGKPSAKVGCYICDISKGASKRYQLSNLCRKQGDTCMPVAPGFIDNKIVTVLRDSGCNCVVVRTNKASGNCMTKERRTCTLADGTALEAPVARIQIDTPYLSGTVEAICLATPMYDLIIGNVIGARPPHSPDPAWQPNKITAVTTRQQAKNRNKPYRPRKLKVKAVDVKPDELRLSQQSDRSLDKLRDLAKERSVKIGKKGSVTWIYKKGLLYREFTPHQPNLNVVKQLVVPTSHRSEVMKLAHESDMSGHRATRRTTNRALSSFYWPGIKCDIQRFCQSCDACRRRTAKERINRVPLRQTTCVDRPVSEVSTIAVTREGVENGDNPELVASGDDCCGKTVQSTKVCGNLVYRGIGRRRRLSRSSRQVRKQERMNSEISCSQFLEML